MLSVHSKALLDFSFIDNLYIFTLISLSDIANINDSNLMLKIICHFEDNQIITVTLWRGVLGKTM
jgi:hypothetical protein